MGALYLYAIADRAGVEGCASLAGRTGLAGAPLLTLAHREIAAVTSPLATACVEATPANVWLHEEVVEAVMAVSPVLPLRWGTVLPGEPRLFALLDAHHDAFAAALARVRGRVELGLRVLLDGGACPPPPAEPEAKGVDGSAATTGRQYLMARVAADRRARAERLQALATADRIHRPLARLAAESVYEVLPTRRTLLAAAYLIDREQVEAARAEAQALAAAFPALRLLLTGPWPPYHFVTGCVPVEALLDEHPPAVAHPGRWRGGEQR